jgi:hypothetical protein
MKTVTISVLKLMPIIHLSNSRIIQCQASSWVDERYRWGDLGSELNWTGISLQSCLWYCLGTCLRDHSTTSDTLMSGQCDSQKAWLSNENPRHVITPYESMVMGGQSLPKRYELWQLHWVLSANLDSISTLRLYVRLKEYHRREGWKNLKLGKLWPWLRALAALSEDPNLAGIWNVEQNLAYLTHWENKMKQKVWICFYQCSKFHVIGRKWLLVMEAAIEEFLMKVREKPLWNMFHDPGQSSGTIPTFLGINCKTTEQQCCHQVCPLTDASPLQREYTPPGSFCLYHSLNKRRWLSETWFAMVTFQHTGDFKDSQQEPGWN